MGLSTFSELLSLSNADLVTAIQETETRLFRLRFRQATRQPFSSHEIQATKRRLAQLKTLCSLRLQTRQESSASINEPATPTSSESFN